MENFNICWEEFEKNASSTYRNLLLFQDFTDVTLACEGDKQVKAHKVILSSCSDFFKDILVQNPHQHPLIYLNGILFKDLQAIMNFIYLGQTEVGQDDIESFMKAAKDLNIKGLSEARGNIPFKSIANDLKIEPTNSEFNIHKKKEQLSESSRNLAEYEEEGTSDFDEAEIIVVLEGMNDSNLSPDYDSMNESVSQSESGKYSCTQCGKFYNLSTGLRRHIKSAHEGVRYPCEECEYKATTGDNLKRHIKTFHV